MAINTLHVLVVQPHDGKAFLLGLFFSNAAKDMRLLRAISRRQEVHNTSIHPRHRKYSVLPRQGHEACSTLDFTDLLLGVHRATRLMSAIAAHSAATVQSVGLERHAHLHRRVPVVHVDDAVGT